MSNKPSYMYMSYGEIDRIIYTPIRADPPRSTWWTW